MQVPIKKEVMLGLFLTSRFLVKIAKRIDKEKAMIFSVITLLSKKPYTIRELADMFFVSHSFMSALCSKLDIEGLIEKKMDGDHRCRKLFLTEKGIQLRHMNQSVGCAACDILFKNMSEPDVQNLGNLIKKLNLDSKGLKKKVNFIDGAK